MSAKLEQIYPWPRPQQQNIGKGTLKISGPIDIQVAKDAGWLRTAAQGVRRVLDTRAAAFIPARGKKVTLTVTDLDGAAGQDAAARKSEGYVLNISPKGIELAGRDAAGIFFAAQVLAQLLEQHAPNLPAQKIRDWPSLPIRGMHMFLPAAKNLDFFGRWLDQMSAFRFNTLFLELGGGFEFKRHRIINTTWKNFVKIARNYTAAKDPMPSSLRKKPYAITRGPECLQESRYYSKDSTHTELAGGKGLARRQIQDIIDECKRRHIQIIPEVQSLSHCYWLCLAYPEIAERSDDPYPDTYCPMHPRTYELLFDALDEIIEVFNPPMIHIGHDELMHIAHCPRCRHMSGHDLLAYDLNRIHDFLADRNIRTVMWGDKLMPTKYGGLEMSKVEQETGRKWFLPATWKAVDKVAKDILIMDWYWGIGQPADEKSLASGQGNAEGVTYDYFAKKGFQKVYGNWIDLEFKDWKHRSDPQWHLGAEVSTWCAVDAYAFGHNRVVNDIFASSSTLWLNRSMEKRRVCELASRWHPLAMDQVSGESRWMVRPDNSRLAAIDLSAVAAPLPKPLAGTLATGKQMTSVIGTGSFTLEADGKGMLSRSIILSKAAGVEAKNAAAKNSRAVVKLGRKAKRLLLMHGTTMEDVFLALTFSMAHRGPAQLINYKVKYADGRAENFTANFGQHIGVINKFWPYPTVNWVYNTCFMAVPAPIDGDHKFYVQEWVNPRPNVAIESLEISLGKDATENGLVLIPAITAVK